MSMHPSQCAERKSKSVQWRTPMTTMVDLRSHGSTPTRSDATVDGLPRNVGMGTTPVRSGRASVNELQAGRTWPRKQVRRR